MKRMVTVMILLGTAVAAWAVEPANSLTQSELKTLIQTAKTPADHMKLADYYRAEVTRLQAEIRNHEEMAAAYDTNPAGHPVPKGQTLGTHCRNLMKDITDEAKEATDMAAMHEQMAKAAR